jgi:hypothetical protein
MDPPRQFKSKNSAIYPKSNITIRLPKLYILPFDNAIIQTQIEVKILKKAFIMILIIILSVTSSINFVTAQNETEISIANTKDENIGRNSEKVECLESGCINISFEDGYRGYCINYGKHEAEIGDSFSPENTSYATNRNTGEDVGNCLKTFFVEYYDHAMKDEIVTQHTIWHFTDDFNGWRLDYDLIDNIRSASSTKEIPDFGAVKKINNTTEAVFDFKVLKSGETDNQNFFIYKIIYRNIIPEILKSNTTNDTMIEQMENSTSQNATTPHENITHEKESHNKAGETTPCTENEQKKNGIMNLSKHVTGRNHSIGIIMLMILLFIVAIKYIRYYD